MTIAAEFMVFSNLCGAEKSIVKLSWLAIVHFMNIQISLCADNNLQICCGKLQWDKQEDIFMNLYYKNGHKI